MRNKQFVLASLLLALSATGITYSAIVQKSTPVTPRSPITSNTTNNIVQDITALNAAIDAITGGSDAKIGTLTNGKWCTSDGSKIQCTADAPSGGTISEATVDGYCSNNGYLTVETDPKVGTLTNAKWCTSDGSKVNCAENAPTLTETDPKVGTITESKYCLGVSGKVDCTANAPTLTENDPKVGTITESKYCLGVSGKIDCTANAPTLTETDPKVGTLTNAKWCTSDGSKVNCAENAPIAGSSAWGDLTGVPAGFSDGTDADTIYTHPTTAGNKHVPAGGATDNVLKYSADGTAVWGTEIDPKIGTITNTKYCFGIGGKIECTANAPISKFIDGTTATDAVFSGGNVGIGTATPTAKLTIDTGNISLTDEYGLGWGGAVPTNGIKGNATTNYVAIKTNNTEKMRVDSSGNVGIGTSTPTAKLDITGTNSTAVIGVELITTVENRDFSGAGNWAGTNWAVGSNVITHTAGANALTLANTNLTTAPVAGKTYQLVFTVNTTTAGTLTPNFGGASGVVIGKQVNSETQTMVVVATGTGVLTFTPDATWAGTLDNISVMEITPSDAVQVIRNSDGTVANEIRSGGTNKYNSFIGIGAGRSNITGYNNLANGYRALYSNTIGYSNTANGALALMYNTEGLNNTANGSYSLFSNTTGSSNVANGYQSLYSNTTGNFNIATGYQSLYYNTTGSGNVANGTQSLYKNTTGSQNVANGDYSLDYNTTGSGNVANGHQSLYKNTTGNFNVANGYNSLVNNTIGNNNVANGYSSLNNNIQGNENTAVGSNSLAYNTEGNYNTANGSRSLLSNTTGNNNTANGYQSLYSNTTGTNNVANGYQSLYYNTTGTNNVANGDNSLYFNTSGTYNVANGHQSLYHNINGILNVALGSQAGKSVNGSNNNTTGDYNVFIGSDTKALADDDQNEIVIGYNATGIGSNGVVLGNDSITKTALKGNVGIGTTVPTRKLTIQGSAQSVNNKLLMLKQANGEYGFSFNINDMNGDGQMFLYGIDISTNEMPNPIMTWVRTGKVGINTTTPAEALDVNGNVQAVGYFYSSDERLKTNITPLNNSLDKITALQGVQFNWKDTTKGKDTQVGLIAQEVEQIFPELVKTNETTGFKSVQYGNLVAPLIEAVKELKTENTDLKEKLEQETQENAEIKERLEKETQENAGIKERLEKLEMMMGGK